MRVQSERRSLVGEESMSYMEERERLNGTGPNTDTVASESEQGGTNGYKEEQDVLSQFHEDALRQAGFGRFQWLALVVTGLCICVDNAEVFTVSYISPNVEVELCLGEMENVWIRRITFLGLAAGAVVWGHLSDHIGRRRTLLSCLSVHVLFTVIAAFMPTIGTLLTARAFSAIGVGGLLPVAVTYFAEFLPKHYRSRYLSWLLVCWPLGGLYAIFLAWVMLPSTGLEMALSNKEHFSAWHQTLLVSTIVSVLALLGLLSLAESGRYLLESGCDVEAMMLYQRTYKLNKCESGQYQLSELELPSSKQAGRGLSADGSDTKCTMATLCSSYLQLFMPPHLKQTSILLLLWFCTGFCYYGLSQWYPDRLSYLHNLTYESETKVFDSVTEEGRDFGPWLENIYYANSLFNQCHFVQMTLCHVIFDNCTFDNVDFADVHSSRSYFMNSLFQNSRFTDTELAESQFHNCRLVNTSVAGMAMCPNNFDYNLDQTYLLRENTVRAVTMLAVFILAGLGVNSAARSTVIGTSLFSSGCLSLFLWLVYSDITLLTFEAVFFTLFTPAISTLSIVAVESYPTHIRATSFGVLACMLRIGGLTGSSLFSQLTPSVAGPAFTAALLLLSSALASFKLNNHASALL